MSYLAECKQIRPQVWRIRWRSTRGTIYIWTMKDGTIAVEYRRYSKLGERLLKNHESERHFIAAEIEKTTGVRPAIWQAVS